MSREQSTVQQEFASSNPEPAEQPAQVDGRGHVVIPTNTEGDLTTSNMQAQGSEINLPHVNPDQGTYKKLYPHWLLLLTCQLQKGLIVSFYLIVDRHWYHQMGIFTSYNDNLRATM